MGGIGDQNLGALGITPRSVVGADDQHTSQFTVCTCCRLQADARKSTDLVQPLLQMVHQRERTLDRFYRLEWMQVRKTWNAGSLFVDLGIVFHRAGSQRIKASIDAVVELRKTGEVAHDIDLCHFWQGQIIPQQVRSGSFVSGTSDCWEAKTNSYLVQIIHTSSVQPFDTSSRPDTSQSISSLVFISVTAIKQMIF